MQKEEAPVSGAHKQACGATCTHQPADPKAASPPMSFSIRAEVALPMPASRLGMQNMEECDAAESTAARDTSLQTALLHRHVPAHGQLHGSMEIPSTSTDASEAECRPLGASFCHAPEQPLAAGKRATDSLSPALVFDIDDV